MLMPMATSLHLRVVRVLLNDASGLIALVQFICGAPGNGAGRPLAAAVVPITSAVLPDGLRSVADGNL